MLPMLYMAMIDDDEVPEFERFYNTYKSKAYFVAYDILRNVSLAEECVSEAFLSIAKSFQIVNNLNANKQLKFVVISIRNTALNILNKEKKNRSENMSSDESIISDSDYREHDIIYWKQCLRKLKKTDLDILYLRCILQLEYKQISQMLGISNGAARVRVHTAKANLKKIIDKEEL